jgi:hypothetical protein
MPRPRRFHTAAVKAHLDEHDGVATHAALMELGMSRSTVVRWARFGPWQRMLPGVVLGHRATPNVRERRAAALAFCGPNAVISGTHALDLHGVLRDRIDVDRDILILIPHREQRTSEDFVVVERTTRNPQPQTRGGLPVAPVARAVADAVRYSSPDADRIRELFGAVVQQRRCSLDELRTELLTGPRQQTGTGRDVLVEVAAGVVSAAEGRAYEVIVGSGLPQPLWNEDVVVDGRWVGEADAYWPDLGVVLEIDSVRWHSTPSDIRRTQDKQRRYAAAGLLVITIAPADVLADPAAFLATIAATLAVAATRRVTV